MPKLLGNAGQVLRGKMHLIAPAASGVLGDRITGTGGSKRIAQSRSAISV